MLLSHKNKLGHGNYFTPSTGVALPFPEHSTQITSEFLIIPLQFNCLLGPKEIVWGAAWQEIGMATWGPMV